jgi:hypothetical protein
MLKSMVSKRIDDTNSGASTMILAILCKLTTAPSVRL